MSNKNLCKGKYLKMQDRLVLDYGLDQNYTLKEIAYVKITCVKIVKNHLSNKVL